MGARDPGTGRRAALAFRGWTAALAMLTSWVPLASAQTPPAAREPGASLDAPALANATIAAGVVNLNTASIDELMRLPGIGPAKARAVLELRRKLTRFSRLEDLMRVKGIGRKTFRKLQPLIRLSGPTTLEDRAARPCPSSVAGPLARSP